MIPAENERYQCHLPPTTSSEDSTCTIPKQQRLAAEKSNSDSDDIEILL
jgi:hypothetical protein